MEPETQPEHEQTTNEQSDMEALNSGESPLAPLPMVPNGLPNEATPIAASGPVVISNQFKQLDRRNIQVDRIVGLIFTSILFTGSIIGLGVLWYKQGANVIWFTTTGMAALINLTSVTFSAFWPSLTFRYTSWRLDTEGLEIRRGVLWRHRITIPLGRVQHADVSQGPLQRPFGIGTLIIHTAGTQHASIPLEGLAYETAVELRDLIVRQKKDQNVV
ncbi:MAG: PH domain-containing protein [Mariniblastus sp.]|nr:PH domain-containing protein [Mariniblastus sp.]